MWHAKNLVAEIRASFVHRHMYESFIRKLLLVLVRTHGPEYLKK